MTTDRLAFLEAENERLRGRIDLLERLVAERDYVFDRIQLSDAGCDELNTWLAEFRAEENAVEAEARGDWAQQFRPVE